MNPSASPHSAPVDARLLDVSSLAYREGLELMRGLVEAKSGAGLPEILILTEHEPVLTLGRRSEPTDVRVSSACLAEKGIAVHRIERGGLATYHGPGQLVAYPIFDLHSMHLGVGDLVTRLEEVLLRTLADFGLAGNRRPGYRGVWTGDEKIASIGIAVRRGITFHGLALNCNLDLSHFDLITPCGIQGVRMTSMARRLGTPVAAAAVRRTMAEHVADLFGLDFSPWSLDEARRVSSGAISTCDIAT